MKLISKERILLFLMFNFIFISARDTQSSDLNNLITKICLERFESEMRLSAKKGPKGMGDFTCKCFTSELDNGSSIDNAQLTCKNKAIKKFNL